MNFKKEHHYHHFQRALFIVFSERPGPLSHTHGVPTLISSPRYEPYSFHVVQCCGTDHEPCRTVQHVAGKLKEKERGVGG